MTSMFHYEKSLPTLPVPLLESTVKQMLVSLQPLLSTEEYENAVSEGDAFVKDPLINLIQLHLLTASKQSCYLNRVTNLDITETLPLHPYLVLEEDPFSKALNPPNQYERAASLINSSLKFIISVRNGTLVPDITPKNATPLTMQCFMNLFGTSRIPHGKNIKMYKYLHINDLRHIVIICNNHFYKLELLTLYDEESYSETSSKHKIWFSDHDLGLLLKEIIEDASSYDQISSNRNSIGCVTTQTYKTWKSARSELEKSNEELLKTIDDALFITVLDPSTPVTDQEKTVAISHGTTDLVTGTNIQRGTCTSRWYDKLQLIVTKNAVAGVVWDSASVDSMAILRFISDIYTDSILKLAKNINGAEYSLFDKNIKFVPGNSIKPEYIPLELNKTPELETMIRISETRLADLIGQHQYNTFNLELENYLMKSANLSTDSVLQVAFQIAHYSLYGKMVNTLEPITTRKFRDSRTELIPIQTEQIAKLAKMYITKADPEEKWQLFLKCCHAHTKQYRDAMQGLGFERHLMALTQVVKRPEARDFFGSLNKELEPIPELEKIEDLYIPLISGPLLDKIFSPELLISNCGNPALRLFGIPPAIDQGFGIGYIIHPDNVVITVCSKFRQADRLLQTFRKVIDDLRDIAKQRSNFLTSINESSSRKLEIQKIRIQQELSNVTDDVVYRHPIDLTIDTHYEEYESQVGKKYSQSVEKKKEKKEKKEKKQDSRGRSESVESNGSNSDEFDLLGGYDYFDMGEVENRSTEMAKAQSSQGGSLAHSRFQSRIQSAIHSQVHSQVNSRRNSNTDLKELGDVKQKLSLSESIRDKLSNSNSNSTESLIARLDSLRPKSAVGRELELTEPE